jgi:hypothetical protein
MTKRIQHFELSNALYSRWVTLQLLTSDSLKEPSFLIIRVLTLFLEETTILNLITYGLVDDLMK